MKTADLTSPIGLIAGNGDFPLEFAGNAKKLNLDVIAVAHVGETDERLSNVTRHCEWIKLGEVGKALNTLKRFGVKQAAFVGGIKKVKLFSGFKPDLRAISIITRARSIKDDVLLREIANEAEREGIEIFSASVLLDRSVPKKGLLTKRALSPEEINDAKLGYEAAKGIGALDIGQTVVVHQGAVVAVEAIDGTDATILRAGDVAKTAGVAKVGHGCVIVKLAKPQQDLRLDLPSVGLTTLENAAKAGVTAIVIDAGKSLILDVDNFLARANELKIAIIAVSEIGDLNS